MCKFDPLGILKAPSKAFTWALLFLVSLCLQKKLGTTSLFGGMHQYQRSSTMVLLVLMPSSVL